MPGIPLKKMADLCHRVGTSYKAGVDIRTIWQRESQSGSPRHRLALGKMAEQISAGRTVAEGMRSTNGYFPELACSITEAGEKGGRLERSFFLLQDHYDAIVRFRRDMLGRLAWPIMELVGAVVIIALMILGMGWATSMNENAEPVDWLGFGWSTMQYFWGWITLVLFFFGTIGFLACGTLAGWFGNVPMQIARKIPVVGKTIQIFSLARFAWVLAAVYEAGMNTMHGVGLAFRATQNFFYVQHEQPVRDKLQEGMQLTDALRQTEAFPDDFLMYMENGEMTGEIPESMTRLAEQYTAEAEKNLTLISRIMFFVIFTLIAILIAIMVISLYARYIGQIQSYM